jgi:hypothetical protein
MGAELARGMNERQLQPTDGAVPRTTGAFSGLL